MATTNICPRCRKLLLPGASFCAYCGTKLAASGGTAKKPVRPRSVALPGERSLIAPCAVVATDARAFAIPDVGRLVAATLKRPLSDVTRQMRFAKGILAEGLTQQEALGFAREARDLGVEAFVLGKGDMVELPELLRMRRPHFDDVGVHCEAYAWDRTDSFQAGWERGFLILGGRICFTEVVEVARERPSLIKRRWAPIAVQVEKHIPKLEDVDHTEFILDVVLFESWQRLRLDENPASYALAGRSEDFHTLIRRSASDLCRINHGVPHNLGLELLTRQAEGDAWGAYTFETKQEFDAYERWVLNVVRYGFNVPR